MFKLKGEMENSHMKNDQENVEISCVEFMKRKIIRLKFVHFKNSQHKNENFAVA